MVDDVTTISNLLYEYAHRFDAADFEGFASLFERGSLNLKGVTAPMSGAEEVLRFVRERVILYDGSPCTNHLIHNPIIEISSTGTEARVRSYVQILQGVADFPLQSIATGRYFDQLIRENGSWYFLERVGEGSLRGDFTHHLRARASA